MIYVIHRICHSLKCWIFYKCFFTTIHSIKIISCISILIFTTYFFTTYICSTLCIFYTTSSHRRIIISTSIPSLKLSNPNTSKFAIPSTICKTNIRFICKSRMHSKINSCIYCFIYCFLSLSFLKPSTFIIIIIRSTY